MNDIEIRRMTAADVDQAAALEEQIFSQPWSSKGFADALAGDNIIFLTAQKKGSLAGYCGMYCALDEGEITNVAVAAEYRNKGIGRLLLKTLLAEAKKEGIATVVLEVRISNAGAIHLYEDLGFEIQGVRKGFYEKPREDGYVMMLSQ